LWSKTREGGERPDLEEVDLGRSVRLLAVADTGACRCKLDVTALQDFGISHRVFTVIVDWIRTQMKWRYEDVLLKLSCDDI
jgi:hypothetical protein